MSISHLEKDSREFIHGDYHERLIMERYETMACMMDAVERGDAQKVLRMLQSGLESIHEVNRLYTPQEENLRQARNRLLSANVVMGMAAYRAGVSPLFLHSLGRRFDKRIDATFEPGQTAALVRDMAEEYCELVRMTNAEQRGGAFSEKVLQLAMSHLAEPLELHELAARMGVAPATLSRRFKAETGRTLTDCLNRRRVKLAQLYMRESDMNLTEIAQRTGFGDASYFSKVFLKYAGMRPSEYMRGAGGREAKAK